jgi:hypothetical protein
VQRGAECTIFEHAQAKRGRTEDVAGRSTAIQVDDHLLIATKRVEQFLSLPDSGFVHVTERVMQRSVELDVNHGRERNPAKMLLRTAPVRLDDLERRRNRALEECLAGECLQLVDRQVNPTLQCERAK